MEDSDFSLELRKQFEIRCSVYFKDFDSNYPMIASTENNVFQFHGLGPVYGEDQGKIVFYLATTKNRGPHGRGTGQIRSKEKLSLNEWHDVRVIKEKDKLHMEVDEILNTILLSEELNEEDFIMKETGNIILLPKVKYDKSFFLNGKIRDFQVLSASRTKSAKK